MAWFAAVKCLDDRLGLDGHFMFRAVGEVDVLFGCPNTKLPLGLSVTIIG